MPKKTKLIKTIEPKDFSNEMVISLGIDGVKTTNDYLDYLAKIEEERIQKEKNIASATEKLEKLGLTLEEIKAII